MPPNNQQPQPMQPQAPTQPANFSGNPQYSTQQDQQFAPPIQQQTAPADQQPTQKGETKKVVNKNTTQNSLLISEIREGMVVLNDGSFRAVVACKSINFDLMSSREREGVEFSYQNFLNALYFPIQIFIRSQRVDIGPYLDKLTVLRRAQDNMLLNVLMDDYINFIDVLSQEANIMDKSFFIVIPFFPAGDLTNVKQQAKGLFGSMFSKPEAKITRIDSVMYGKAKDEIKNRVDSVMSGLFQLGVKSVQLNTKELGELYYNVYNPDTAVREPLGDFSAVTSTYVRKGQGEALRPHLQEGGL